MCVRDKNATKGPRMTRPTFSHPVPRQDITDDNFRDIANDLFYLQSEEMIRMMRQMIEVGHWGDDDTDYFQSMRDAHANLQFIAYEGTYADLTHFLFSHDPTGNWEGLEGSTVEPLSYLNSAGGFCDALCTYLPKD